MPGYQPGVKQACQKRLAAANITLLTNQRVTEITDKALRLESDKNDCY
jgi:NADH dehydrogenase FAD-containing subunit